jgi:hypothetical protein
MRNKESWNLKSWGGVIVRPQSDSLFNPYVDHLNCDKVLYVNDKVLYVNDKVLYVNDKVLYVNDILTFRVVWLYVSFCHQIL